MAAVNLVIQLSLIVPLVITLLVRFTTGKTFQRIFHSIFPWLCGLYCLLYPFFTWEIFTHKANSFCGLCYLGQVLLFPLYIIVVLPIYTLIVYTYSHVFIKADLDYEERGKITDAERDKW